MWTNVFRIDGLNQLSWFQFMPNENEREQRDVEVIKWEVELMKQGYLTTWTNSFLGPWDPSQGSHNPDEKIKLWLFLPGRHSSLPPSLPLPLRVVASGFWVSPGDSEQVSIALSQALRNRLQRPLAGLSYLRYGDVFAKYHPFSHSDQLFRRGQLTVEFVFAATEEAIFVHVILSEKHVRSLSGGDMEKVLKLSSSSVDRRLPVIVSPHGMRGEVTGCCLSDLVKHVYIGSGMSKVSGGLVGLPYNVSQACGCKLRGQKCYIEVSIGCGVTSSGKGNQPYSGGSNTMNHATSNTCTIARGDRKGSIGDTSCLDKTFIYPTEAVLVPVLHTSYARSSLKRLWLQKWAGLSLSASGLFVHCSNEADDVGDSWSDSDGICNGLNSSSNSNHSSISSLSSSSSDSDDESKARSGDLEADADSLTGRHSGLSCVDPMDTNGSKQGAKRPRTGLEDSYGQAGCSNSGVTVAVNDQGGGQWDWDDDDRGAGMDIQTLLSEFGDFGDFFEGDSLPFGEPPGTAESQALVLSGAECEGGGSPSAGAMDVSVSVSDPMLLPATFSTLESFNPPALMEECISTTHETTNTTLSSAPLTNISAASTGEFDHVIKAEALLTFAPEYGAVDTSSTELSSAIVRSPYQPKSHKADSLNSSGSNYVYGATPPSSPGINRTADKPVDSRKHDIGAVLHKFYTQVESSERAANRRLLVTYNNTSASPEGTSLSLFSGFNSSTSNVNKCVESKMSEVCSGAKHLVLSQTTVPAAELECLMFQAGMCRIRHTLFSVSNPASGAWNRPVVPTALSQIPGEASSSMIDDFGSKYEVKKECIPVRIAGDVDRGGILDGPSFDAPIGVWRSVGAPKPAKPANTPNPEVLSSLSHHHPFNEESIVSDGKRVPLVDFLNAMALLVQQAASFVDVGLDGECGDGPYAWLSLQEQRRRAFCCGPNMAHAGCGGLLASCHAFDIAGVHLPNPISTPVQVSSMLSVLQSDVKAALKSAFGSLEGPLSVMDWCKGRQAGEELSSEYRDSCSSIMTSVGDPASPSNSSAVSSAFRDGNKVDDSCQKKSNQDLCMSESEQQLGPRRRPTLFVVPYPSILVGYQDDWLKTSASSLLLWEKAPLEPYAFQKHMSYYVVCPNINPLTTAASDFFHQLGTVYEMCKLGTHSPQSVGNQMELDSGKSSPCGFVLLDCPQSIKIENNTGSLVGSISDYIRSLSNGLDFSSFLKSLTKALKTLHLGPNLTTNAKGQRSPCTVIYIVCPFPDPNAILETIVESCAAIGSLLFSSENDRRCILHTQVSKALSYSAGVDETYVSSIPALCGFSVPRLVLQVVTVDAIFRVTSPNLSELVLLKEIAFTVYNKARCISQGSPNDVVPPSSVGGGGGRSHSLMMHMGNPVAGMWKDAVGSRISGPSLPREGELESGGLRSGGHWDNTWPTRAAAAGLGSDPVFQEELHYMFEPLFILAEAGGCAEQGVSPATMELTKQQVSDECVGGFMTALQDDGTEADGYPGNGGRGGVQMKAPPPPARLHCCYGWTEDWRWLVCIWTDSRGELLDNHIFPFGGISSRQDTKGMQNLFVQLLQQGHQILQGCASSDNGAIRPRDIVITRIGCFYELECQEWQKALYSIGGSEVKKWPLQLRRGAPDGMGSSGNGGGTLEMDRSSSSSTTPLYASGFIKGQASGRKQQQQQQTNLDGGGSRGSLQWARSISFVSLSLDHSLHLVSQSDVSTGGSSSQVSGGVTGSLNHLEGFTHVRSLGSTSASYIMIPSPSMRFMTPTPLQLPTCLTCDSPPLAHLLHSKGYAIPLSTAFVVSKALPSLVHSPNHNLKDSHPSVLSVSLIDYYGGYAFPNDKPARANTKQGGRGGTVSDGVRDFEVEIHVILESLAAELHALSWMSVSPAYPDRRTPLPFHCDTVLRLRRLLHFADKHISH